MLSLANRLELYVLAALPSFVTLILAVFCLAPKHVEGLGSVMPLLPLMPVFYWGMQHARAIPYWFLFAVGLMMDAASGLPLGMSSLLYVLFLVCVHIRRKYIHREGFLVLWGFFALLLAATLGAHWLLLSWYHARALPAASAFVQYALTVACYPFVHALFDRIEHYIYGRRWHILHGN